MDSREIEAQIKGLLGLQLGAQAADTAVPPGAYPRNKNRWPVLPQYYWDMQVNKPAETSGGGGGARTEKQEKVNVIH